MGLHITNVLLRHATVTATYHLSTLGPRQIKALCRFVKAGVISGHGVPAQIAQHILNSRGVSFAKYNGGGIRMRLR